MLSEILLQSLDNKSGHSIPVHTPSDRYSFSNLMPCGCHPTKSNGEHWDVPFEIQPPCEKLSNYSLCQRQSTKYKNLIWMFLPNFKNFDFLSTNFLPNYQTISIPFSIKKISNLPKLGAFYNNLLKIHLIFVFGLLRL